MWGKKKKDAYNKVRKI